ncbi:MAG: folylpolyglutamate synthase/dihydrofolate synthase family protein [Vicinamibacterales bacterium]
MNVDPFAYLFSLEQFGIKFGLDNMRAMVDGLGQPQEAFRSVHIAGTNGKGSVSAMVESVLRAAGAHTGRYTSPHLIDLTERFAIDGQPIGVPPLSTALREVIEVVSGLRRRQVLETPPTFFEVTTAAAFALFRREQVEVAVCEVGLGGRLDATNVLSPIATAITSIGVDHERYLGSTLADIAAEKAGTIKPGVPVVVGNMTREAHAVIARVARGQQAPLIDAHRGVECTVRPSNEGPWRQHLQLRTPLRDYHDLELGLAGAHQIGNAIVAVRLLETVSLPGRVISDDAIRTGLQRVVWPGRLQRVDRPGGRSVLLDAAHNPDGARTLAEFLEPRGACPLVFAAMRDKDIEGILAALRGRVSAIVLTRASHPRSAEPAALYETAGRILGAIPRLIVEAPDEALDAAWTFAPDIVVAGSIFLLGDIMKGLAAP